MNSIRARMLGCVRRLVIAPLCRFGRNQNGTAAVELGFVLAPFVALLFAIMETAIIFLTTQTLETAVLDSARLILTGQAQNGGYDDATNFKNKVCDNIHGLVSCADISVDVRAFPKFSAITPAALPPLVDAQGKVAAPTFQQSAQGDVVVVRIFFPMQIFASYMNPGLINVAGNKRLIVATATFRNEPY
jgi:Flp pilus assembly protein TadG